MNAFKNNAVRISPFLGVAYGLLCRLIYSRANGSGAFAIMTIGFLMVMPMAVGFIGAFLAVRAGASVLNAGAVIPLFSAVALLLGAFVFFWEGGICVVLLAPIALLMSVIGGACGVFCAQRMSRKPLLCVALLPFAVSAAEHFTGPAYEHPEIESSIVIHASPADVWRQIERVPLIHPDEQRFSWTQKIGFPRPLEATLSGDGIGAVRHATFAGGVLFVETVTSWERERSLGFDIRADTASIPPRTLDEHVTIGGPYFDALHGEYTIVPQPGGAVLLRLVSRHRLSTTFNFYARIWVNAIMGDIQRNILYVIRNRCEHPAAHPAP